MPKLTIDEEKLPKLERFLKVSLKSAENLTLTDLCKLRFSRTVKLPYPASDSQWEEEAEDTNFMEFLNQFFTTLATVIAIKEYFPRQKCTVNLGEREGRDLIAGESIAEIFAVTKTASNSKLKKEIISLTQPKEGEKAIRNRYVIFILAQNDYEKLNEETAAQWVHYNSQKEKCSIVSVEGSFHGDNDKCEWNCLCNEDPVKICCFSEAYASAVSEEYKK